jgi:RimJ/RimL family protein N-acetyltransferase
MMRFEQVCRYHRIARMEDDHMDVTIRRISAEHVEGFHRALDHVARERKYLTVLEAPALAETRKFVMNNIARGYPQFVAIAGNDVVGWCDVIPRDRPLVAHCGVVGMGLLPPFRGKGNGVALIDATLTEARRTGIVRIELRVYANNKRAIALYKKVGFKREGRLRHAVLLDGHYMDMIVMAIINRPTVVLDDLTSSTVQ